MADRALQERTKEKSGSVAKDAEKYTEGPVQPGALDLDGSTGPPTSRYKSLGRGRGHQVKNF